MKYILILLFLAQSVQAQVLQTVFEQSGGRQTATYREIIAFYQALSRLSPGVTMKEMGASDAGFPLHLVLFSNKGALDPTAWHAAKKVVIFINNGIHPGEPDGIDATVIWMRDLVTGKKKIPDNVAIAAIPVYNIGGCLNRSTNYRVDQNGPEAFGSRGNSQNLDLNRDFIKSDSKEARSFAAIFHYLDPDIFIDNHVSNGADYQHVMSLISSQHSKLGGPMGEFMNRQFEPALYASMKKRGYDLVPYVDFTGETPDAGWPEFFDSPRYSSGYATLWNTFGFTTETHMLKPYRERVQSTISLMECFADFAAVNGAVIRALRQQTLAASIEAASFPVRWILDSTRYTEIPFKGFEAGKKTSEVSGQPRLYYDRSKPFEKKVPFYNIYTPTVTVKKPRAYIIPQGWWKVVELLGINGVSMRRLPNDTTITVESYRITDYTSTLRPFEMHHPNSEVKVSASVRAIRFRKGDYYVPMNQRANRFLAEVLEPQSNDSYFCWNFFDGILAPKEGYSHYVFEEKAAAFLEANPFIRKALGERVLADTAFARDGRAQLDFVYRNSPYAEPEYLQYPVYRVL